MKNLLRYGGPWAYHPPTPCFPKLRRRVQFRAPPGHPGYRSVCLLAAVGSPLKRVGNLWSFAGLE